MLTLLLVDRRLIAESKQLDKGKEAGLVESVCEGKSVWAFVRVNVYAVDWGHVAPESQIY